MPGVERARSSTVVDFIWRVALRFGFRLGRVWWSIRPVDHEGALVAIYVGDALLLLKSSYRVEWNFVGGSVHPGETPEAAALREMEEEIGLSSYPVKYVGSSRGMWDGRRDRVYFFELRLDTLPELTLDNREIIGARLVSPDELKSTALTDAVVAYLRGDLS